MENATDKQIAFLKKNNIDATHMDKHDAHKLIADLLNKPDLNVPVVRPGHESKYISNDAYEKLMAKPKTSSQSSFYVAYAKDLYIANLEKGVDDMQKAIDCIKLAKEQL